MAISMQILDFVSVACLLLHCPAPVKGFIRTAHHPPTLLSAWSQQASFGEESQIHLSNCDSIAKQKKTVIDLSSPRQWLEFHADGAYTVMRCDWFLRDDGAWHRWGQEVHAERLDESYREFAALQNTTVTDSQIQTALDETRMLIDSLLKCARDHLLKCVKAKEDEAGWITCMVTLLWTTNELDKSRINVQGHLVTPEKKISQSSWQKQRPSPVHLSIGWSLDHDKLPSRHAFSTSKLSCWCRDRRTLEEQFQRDGCTEVVLTARASDRQTLLLEGLTSNLFVVYENNVLRTAGTGILHGYARKLVLEHAEQLGLAVEFVPPRLREMDEWVEVFLTSSVQLIVPVSEVFLPTDTSSLETVWSSTDYKVSQMLYDSIIQSSKLVS
jgi:hypothetical protein